MCVNKNDFGVSLNNTDVNYGNFVTTYKVYKQCQTLLVVLILEISNGQIITYFRRKTKQKKKLKNRENG